MKRFLVISVVLVGVGSVAWEKSFPFPTITILASRQSPNAASVTPGTSRALSIEQLKQIGNATIISDSAGSPIMIESRQVARLFALSATNLRDGTRFAAASAGGYNSGLYGIVVAAINSPNITPISVTMDGGSGCSNSLDLMQACNSQYLAAGVFF